ncbi:hypothetical protein J2T11_003034 [Paenarthrobacter nicotinovorans]|uniref:hypothetical protein n=1 Tax=Paenarthrobacter nicotinovorans TaxID=29320 RepID=UPI00278A2352|nr:hypothetical protein [Paenarthrobacter nicotinovorans]MDP9936666.1 hypothetical protein [Paenarthrobacter nicotinovorans]
MLGSVQPWKLRRWQPMQTKEDTVAGSPGPFQPLDILEYLSMDHLDMGIELDCYEADSEYLEAAERLQEEISKQMLYVR